MPIIYPQTAAETIAAIHGLEKQRDDVYFNWPGTPPAEDVFAPEIRKLAEHLAEIDWEAYVREFGQRDCGSFANVTSGLTHP